MDRASLEASAIAFTKMWCNLFVGDKPDIERAISLFTEDATIVIPNVPYRVRRDDDREEIHFSHLVDGRGQVHFWQVLEPQVALHGPVAIVTYYARYNIGRKGESTIKCAKETLVLIGSRDEWRIAHMHNSAA